MPLSQPASDKIAVDAPAKKRQGTGLVLAVDLDGTLVQTDMLHETFWAAVSSDPRAIVASAVALLGGKAALKSQLAERVTVDPTTLPYDERVLARVSDWRAKGGRTALVTATDARVAQGIADHLGLFDEVHGSTPACNLKGRTKAEFLTDRFGLKGYVYVGDSAADLPVWQGAAEAVSVGSTPAICRALDRSGTKIEHMPPHCNQAVATLRAMRPRQWLKNILVVIPPISDHAFGSGQVLAVFLAFVALSAVASSGYVINDLLDLSDDRSHPRKRNRPFASGALSAATGSLLWPALLIIGLGAALAISPLLFAVVGVYFVSTVAYSVKLKRHNILDICVLAFLFTLRILAGGVTIGASLSVWLLAFSMFIFLALGAVKRLAELSDFDTADRPISRRDYMVQDRALLSQISITSGYVAVLVLALYFKEPSVQGKFDVPWMLWGICPILLFWVSRLVLVASRGEMHEDPFVWALQNRTSQITLGLIAFFIVGAVML